MAASRCAAPREALSYIALLNSAEPDHFPAYPLSLIEKASNPFQSSLPSMVDPVGATLGVLGLAGLFTVCVDCFDYIKASRSVGKSFAIRETQFGALRMRLFAWGHAVRLTDRAGYDARLDDPRWKHHVQQQLNVISLLFIDVKKIIKRYDLEERFVYHAQGPTGVNAVFLEENFKDFLQRAKRTQEKAGIFNSMRYSLSSQKDFKELLENLEKAVKQT